MKPTLYVSFLRGLAAGALCVGLASMLASTGCKGAVKEASAAECKAKSADLCLPELYVLDTDGEGWTADTLHGKVVMVNFWATWCKPCKKELPALSAAYKKYKDQGFVLLGVMTDDVPTPKLQAFQKARGMTYPVVRMDQELIEAFEYPESLPTTFIYSRDGRLHKRLRGEIKPAKLERILKKLLADPVPPPPKKSKKTAQAE